MKIRDERVKGSSVSWQAGDLLSTWQGSFYMAVRLDNGAYAVVDLESGIELRNPFVTMEEMQEHFHGLHKIDAEMGIKDGEAGD